MLDFCNIQSYVELNLGLIRSFYCIIIKAVQ